MHCIRIDRHSLTQTRTFGAEERIESNRIGSRFCNFFRFFFVLEQQPQPNGLLPDSQLIYLLPLALLLPFVIRFSVVVVVAAAAGFWL